MCRRSTPEHSDGIEGSQEEPEQFGLIAHPLLNTAKRPPWTQFREPCLTYRLELICSRVCACARLPPLSTLHPPPPLLNHSKICPSVALLRFSKHFKCTYVCVFRRMWWCACSYSSAWVRSLWPDVVAQLLAVTFILGINDKWWRLLICCWGLCDSHFWHRSTHFYFIFIFIINFIICIYLFLFLLLILSFLFVLFLIFIYFIILSIYFNFYY